MPSAARLKEPQVLVRAGLGLLLVANLVAAGIAFHLFGSSPEALDRELIAAQARLQAQQLKLNRSRLLTANVGKGKSQIDAFLASHLTNRRHTYSTIISEITDIAKTAGMKTQEWTIAPLDPIEGSRDLSMMTVSVNFEGGYPQLVKFVNLLDRSPRFLIIEGMTAAPQPKGDLVTANLKLNAFILEDAAGSL